MLILPVYGVMKMIKIPCASMWMLILLVYGVVKMIKILCASSHKWDTSSPSEQGGVIGFYANNKSLVFDSDSDIDEEPPCF